jgi:hypothetical protein
MQIEKEMFRRFTKTFDNFDRIAQCLYEIAIVSAGRNDNIVSGIIEDCIKDLEKQNEKTTF